MPPGPDEKGRQNDFDADDDKEENMDGEPSNNRGFFSRMRAQVAARVSSNADQDASNPGFGSTSDSNMLTEQTTHASDGSPVLASGNPPAPRPHTPPATSGQATSSSLGPSSHTPPAPSPQAYPAALPDHSSNSTVQTSPRQPRASPAPIQNNIVPQPRAPTPMSDLSDVEALEECRKRATIKKERGRLWSGQMKKACRPNLQSPRVPREQGRGRNKFVPPRMASSCSFTVGLFTCRLCFRHWGPTSHLHGSSIIDRLSAGLHCHIVIRYQSSLGSPLHIMIHYQFSFKLHQSLRVVALEFTILVAFALNTTSSSAIDSPSSCTKVSKSESSLSSSPLLSHSP
ncbi:hypothetical protein JVT61DRAFT_12528 [Boletus reticuloceps]|uniref:Uncharacterized protein n=1 Tax=Boletus reticuloceps TaxID=495285 RepID=A0A8I2YDF6_9AGAM|nr:hypothetical protein JVT61DRAFT_13535 [Boletus reticuloceps]KAG6370010.1 hypothetical protein JVT61DRAFT_12528 [Boletus reticuloceps]